MVDRTSLAVRASGPLTTTFHLDQETTRDWSTFSSFCKLTCVLSWCKRFVLRCRLKSAEHQAIETLLTPEENIATTHQLLKLSQQQSFPDTYQALLGGRSPKAKDIGCYCPLIHGSRRTDSCGSEDALAEQISRCLQRIQSYCTQYRHPYASTASRCTRQQAIPDPTPCKPYFVKTS